mgnify:CR=1 FL=1
MAISHQTGFYINSEEITPTLYPHVKDTVRWAVAGGCRAIFSSFGMQKDSHPAGNTSGNLEP